MVATQPLKSPRVFGIGFSKTGTTSLGVALRFLRYTVCHAARPVRRALGQTRMMDLLRRGELEPVLDIANAFDAFEDTPWFVIYRELDERFPGSKFILTEREEARWIASALRYFGDTSSDMRQWIFGSGGPIGNEQAWLDRYRRHNEDVRTYFRARPDDLLIVDWERGSGWDDLAPFLGVRRPSGPFPHVNRSGA